MESESHLVLFLTTIVDADSLVKHILERPPLTVNFYPAATGATPSLSVDKSTLSQSPPPPEEVPLAEWHQNSCSLDSSMAMGIRVRQELGEICEKVPSEKKMLLFETLGTAVAEWTMMFGPYQHWPLKELTERRDSCRDLLRRGHVDGVTITIGADSAVENTLDLFIPSVLSKIKAKFIYQCTPKGKSQCTEGGDQILTTERVWDHLNFPAAWAHNSSTHQIIARLVMALLS